MKRREFLRIMAVVPVLPAAPALLFREGRRPLLPEWDAVPPNIEDPTEASLAARFVTQDLWGSPQGAGRVRGFLHGRSVIYLQERLSERVSITAWTKEGFAVQRVAFEDDFDCFRNYWIEKTDTPYKAVLTPITDHHKRGCHESSTR